MRALNRFLAAVAFLLMAPNVIASNCNWNTTPSSMNFGNYSVFSPTGLSTSTNFAFRCTPNTYARLTLSRGNSGVYTPARQMRNGATSINYNIYLDAAGSQIWGDTTGGSVSYDVYNSTPQSKDFIDNMFGVASASQDLPAGTYTDTIFVTLGYSNTLAGPYTNLPNITMTVQVIVLAECRVDAFNLDFGNYNPFTATALGQTTTLKVYCTKNSAPASVTLNNGSFALGTQNRMMSSAGVFLNYSAALGSTAGNSTSMLVPINNGFTINGSIPANQDVAVGAYSDTLIANVNY